MKASLVRTRVTVLAAVAAASVLLLSACGSGDPQPQGSGDPTDSALVCQDTPTGGAADEVTISGDFGAKPTVEFADGLTTDKTVRDVVIEGDGAEIKPGDLVTYDLTMYNGTSGEVIAQTPYAGSGQGMIEVDDTKFYASVVRAIECVNEGSRVVAVVSADDAADVREAGAPITEKDALIIVADAVGIVSQVATGTPQPQVEGLPKVTLDDEGVPTIEIPDAEPPADLKLAVLKQGDGEKVKDGDMITIQYQGVNWRTGEVFDQSWGRGAYQGSVNNFIPGFTAAMVGFEVGSQILTVIPPAQGYGPEGNSQAGIEGTDTLVFVVDILAASPGTAAAG